MSSLTEFLLTSGGVGAVGWRRALGGAGVGLAVSAAGAGAGAGAQAGTLVGGVNLSAMEIGTVPGRYQYDYTTPTLAEMQYYCTQKKLCLFRLPILLERLEPSMMEYSPAGQQPLNSAYVGLIEGVLTNAASVGAKVLVDMHDYGAYYDATARVSYPLSGAGTYKPYYLAWAWQELAADLKGYAGLGGYDIQNEPNTNAMPSGTWPTTAQHVTTHIRRVDTVTPIYVSMGCGEAAPGVSSCTQNPWVTDPDHAVVYEAHVYGDGDNCGCMFTWGTSGATTETIANNVQPFIQWCHTMAAACMVGETGVVRDDTSSANAESDWLADLSNGLAAMQTGGLQAFTYWAGGPWWGTYPLSIEPDNGVDASQMAIVQQYGSNEY